MAPPSDVEHVVVLIGAEPTLADGLGQARDLETLTDDDPNRVAGDDDDSKRQLVCALGENVEPGGAEPAILRAKGGVALCTKCAHLLHVSVSDADHLAAGQRPPLLMERTRSNPVDRRLLCLWGRP